MGILWIFIVNPIGNSLSLPDHSRADRKPPPHTGWTCLSGWEASGLNGGWSRYCDGRALPEHRSSTRCALPLPGRRYGTYADLGIGAIELTASQSHRYLAREILALRLWYSFIASYRYPAAGDQDRGLPSELEDWHSRGTCGAAGRAGRDLATARRLAPRPDEENRGKRRQNCAGPIRSGNVPRTHQRAGKSFDQLTPTGWKVNAPAAAHDRFGDSRRLLLGGGLHRKKWRWQFVSYDLL